MPTLPRKSVRLSNAVAPAAYHLRLTPDLVNFTFSGEETIKLRIHAPVRQITLHAKELMIERAELRKSSGARHGRGGAAGASARAIAAAEIRLDEEEETATFIFSETIPAGNAELTLSFKGILNDKMRGFYRSRYTDPENGGERYLAATQFEATDARRAFPCFDEPAMKAAFHVRIFAPKGMIAISNTPVARTERAKGGAIYAFAATPKMSTYLLAFIVGRFETAEKKNEDGVTVRVCTLPGKREQSAFALEVAGKILSFFGDYFGIPYPLPHLQLITIPDFSSAAMENWGAVTFRESALLIDPRHSAAINKQRVAHVIAHELAHQWFGNLVTMRWWTDLWLNEGFASYISYLGVHHLFPEWGMWTQFVSDELGGALAQDALRSTHPIEVEVRHPDEINEIFDEISYEKGAAVIRMAVAYLGEAVFRKGLRQYLRRHRYGNATTNDLWRALETASGKPVMKMMRVWTGKPGHPFVSLEDRGAAVRCSAKRFFLNANILKTSREKTVWPIPLGIEGRSGAWPDMMAKRALALRNVPLGRTFNTGQTGVFRVRYSAPRLATLARRVCEKELPAADRLGIVRDAFHFAEAGVMDTAAALALAAEYTNENEYAVWAEAATGLAHVNNLLFGHPLHDAFRNFARGLFADAARKTGWHKRPDESHTETLLRSLALGAFGGYGDRETIRTARQLFVEYQVRHKEVEADVRSVAYRLTAQHGTPLDHESFVKLYRKAPHQQEKDRLSGALASFRDPSLLRATLEFAISEAVRPQDTPLLAAATGANTHGRLLTWEFVQKHWGMFTERYGGGGHLLPRFIHFTGGFTDRDRAEEVEKFFRKHGAPGAERAVAQAAERIRSNAAWLARDQKKLEPFLVPYHPQGMQVT